MEFREKQIELFIEQTRAIAESMGMVPSARTGNMVQEDEYISGILGEVEERLISLSSARISILNYLNQQVDAGNGDAFNRMREEFLKISTWVRNIEVEVLGHPAIDETGLNPDTQKPIVSEAELQQVQDQIFPPGFRAFTGAEESAIQQMKEKIETEQADDSTQYDPYFKDVDQDEQIWEERFKAKELEASLHLVAYAIARNNSLFDNQLMVLLDTAIYQKQPTLINEHFIQRMNELIADEVADIPEACSVRVSAIVAAANLFVKEFNPIEVDFATRKELGLTVTTAGSETTFKPADMIESIQFILMKMGALRPLSTTEIELFAKFIEANKDKENDVENLLGILNGIAQLYVFQGFVDTGGRLAEAMEVFKKPKEAPAPEVAEEPTPLVENNAA